MKVSIPVFRSLQQLSKNGYFEIFAIDHRDVYVNMLKDSGKYINEQSVIESKLEIIREVQDLVSGYLVDPFYVLPYAIEDESIPASVGFMVHIENNDYRVEGIGANYCIKELTPDRINKMGASAVKMFLYYNPESPFAEAAEEQIRNVAKNCAEAAIPFLIEPVIFACNKDEVLSSEKRYQLLFKMLDRFKDIPISIYKINFPGSLEDYSDEENIRLCRAVTDYLDVPWVIMSSDVTDEVFEKQLTLACKGGACGYVAGRSVWKQFIYSDINEKESELQAMRERLQRINVIVENNASKWTERIEVAEQPEKEWYATI